MAAPIAAIAKVAAAVLSDERGRKAIGWIVVAILAPVILLVAAFCSILGGSADHNNSVLQLCFSGGALPANMPAEYRVYVEDMQHSFALLDGYMETVNNMTEGETGLDAIRVKAIFYALYFGDEAPSSRAHQQFVDCFVTYEERTRTVTTTDKEGNEVETEESYTVAIPITDLETVWANIQAATGLAVTEEHRSNADSIYNLVRYGSSTGTEDWIPGAEAPFIGADGFCSPIGSGWESRVTSEFGYRRDPFTGETRGHTGIDIAVPTGTPVRAALPGVVTTATYNAGGYGYYVMIDHGNGMVTLYAEGYSGGGETMSQVMGMRPDLFTAYLQCSSQWDGAYEPVVEARVPVYFVIGESDEYYGSGPSQEAYDSLHELYEQAGLSQAEIDQLLVLDIKDADYFRDGGAPNQHGGGNLFAQDPEIMGWLFKQ